MKEKIVTLSTRREVTISNSGHDRVTYLVLGSRGAVQFVYLTTSRFDSPLIHQLKSGMYGIALDLGYHSPRKKSYSTPMAKCPYLEGQCYYDGSGLAALDIMKEWINTGEDNNIIYEHLKAYYNEVFIEDLELDA